MTPRCARCGAETQNLLFYYHTCPADQDWMAKKEDEVE